MDLSQLASTSTESRRMDVLHPKTGLPVEGMYVDVVSFTHADVQNVVRAQKAKQALKVDRYGRPVPLTEEEERKNDIEIVCVLAKGWGGFEMHGKTLACEQAAKVSLFSNNDFNWLVKDIVGYAQNAGNFLPTNEPVESVAKVSRVAVHKAEQGTASAG